MKKYKCDKCDYEDDVLFNIMMIIGKLQFDVCSNCFVKFIESNCGKVIEQKDGETKE